MGNIFIGYRIYDNVQTTTTMVVGMAGLREYIRGAIREAIKEALEEVKAEVKEIIKDEIKKVAEEELKAIFSEDFEDLAEKEVIKGIKEIKKDVGELEKDAVREEIKEEIREVKELGLDEFLEKPLEIEEEEAKKKLKLYRGKIIITARRSDVDTGSFEDFVLNVVEKVILSCENETIFLETIENLEDRLKDDIREFLSNYFNKELAESVNLRSDIMHQVIGEVEKAESKKNLVKCVLIVDEYDYSEELESFLKARGW